jgi:hypothetical protein
MDWDKDYDTPLREYPWRASTATTSASMLLICSLARLHPAMLNTMLSIKSDDEVDSM